MNIIDLERELTELVKKIPCGVEVTVGDETLLNTKKPVKQSTITLNGTQYLLVHDPRWYLHSKNKFERISSNWKGYRDIVGYISKFTKDTLKENGIDIDDVDQFNVQLIGASRDLTPEEIKAQLYASIESYLTSENQEFIKSTIEQKIKPSFFALGKKCRYFKSKVLINGDFTDKEVYTDKTGKRWLLMDI